MTAPLVIAIAGPPGSGKTSLARALAERLGGAPVISYDAYEEITGWPPERVSTWLGRDAPFDEIPVPGLAQDLIRLRNREPILDRETGQTRGLGDAAGGRPVILFDTLLGRAHRETGALIDRLIWLDLPLDIALARKLRTFTEDAHRDPRAGPALLEGLDAYLARYASLLHPIYAIQRERVRTGSDRVLGHAPLADLVAAAFAMISETEEAGR